MGATFHQQFYYIVVVKMNGVPQRCVATSVSKQKTKPIPWPESASELYRPSGSRLSAKLVPTFVDRGVLHATTFSFK
jgi:hypothetical protein